MASGENNEPILHSVSVALYLAPTCAIVAFCFIRQCCSPRGGYGRLRTLSLRQLCTGCLGAPQAHDQGEYSDVALANMLADAREPLIVDQLREERDR